MKQQAFTLVEVVIALGIVVFGLIAIFGLMSLSLKNSHEANLRQGLTLAIDQMNSTYQSRNFTNALSMVPSPTNFYFDNVGAPLTSATGAYFQCSVSNVTPPTADANFLAVLQLQILSPVSHPTSTNISVFSILNNQ